MGDKTYFCPLLASSNGLEIEVNRESYTPNLQIVEPQSIVCRTGIIVCGSPSAGTAGQIGMKIDPIIQPETVAFNGVRMMEIPMLVSSTPPSGYFTNEVNSAFWAHTRARGAGVWRTPTQANLFFVDTVSFGEPCPPPWSNGSIDWDVPIGWGDRDAESVVDVVKEVPRPYHQITTIDPQGGVKVEKYEQWVKRMPDGEISHSPGIRNIIDRTLNHAWCMNYRIQLLQPLSEMPLSSLRNFHAH